MKPFLSILLLGLGLQAQAQLAVTNGAVLTVTSGTTISYDGLALTPSANFAMSNTTLSRGTTITRTSTNPAITRVYKFSNPVTAYAGNIQMTYATGELNGITETNLQLNLDNSTAWTKIAGTVNTTNKTVTATGIASTTISELTLASTTGPLPLELLSFEAKPVENTSKLHWSIAKAAELQDFTVQHSIDGKQWANIGIVAARNTKEETSYGFVHTTPVNGVNHYRLLITETSGATSYSQVAVVLHKGKEIAFSAYPNPTTDQMVITSPVTGTLSLVDATGRVLKIQAASTGLNTINIQELPSGSYWLQYQGEGKSGTIHISKL